MAMCRINTIPNDGIIRYKSILNAERLIVASPKALSEVLTTRNYDYMKPKEITLGIGKVLGIGVLLAEGEEHKFQRKHLMPAFAFRRVKDLYPVFWGKSREAAIAMTKQIKADAGKDIEIKADIEKSPISNDQAIFEVGAWASRATLDIIGVAAMGQDFHAIQNPEHPLNKTYHTVFQPSSQAQVLGFINLFIPHWISTRLPLARNTELEEAASTIRGVCRQMIRSKKEKLNKKELTDTDLLSIALESGAFGEEDLVDQLMTFLAAGHETTASAMTWAIYMLCLNPSVQTRLRAEIREKLPSVDENSEITSLEIDHLPYLNAVCNEVLRYYSPVPMSLREAVVETSIQGIRIPKGTKIMLVPWAVNKDTHAWGPDARTFNPDRWISDTLDNDHAATGGATSNYSFLTFLHGPRSCIGQGFAKAEFACLLAAWVGRMQFELLDERERDEKKMLIKGGITARPAKGFYVKARVVEGW